MERPRGTPQQMRPAGDGRASTLSRRHQTPVYNSARTESRFKEESLSKQRKSAIRGKGRDTRSPGRPTARSHRDVDRPTYSFDERTSNQNDSYPSLSSKTTAYKTFLRTFSGEHKSPSFQKSKRKHESNHSSLRTENFKNPSRPYESQGKSFGSEDIKKPSKHYESQGEGFGSEGNGKSTRQHKLQERTRSSADDAPPFTDQSSKQSRVDKRIPVPIPYTTPASDFLYGFSVVEAALRSNREPRRKLYKLYIYKGENRTVSSVKADTDLERLAKKNNVKVVRVSGDWLRVMDKMSFGRPHNGYILEASPLPRKPIASLGEFSTTEGQPGFKVTLDHQSAEEAAVNGTDDFIKYVDKPPGRKPLVLLLDSIVDPGNLGGIIRTASFLGVTAIAVSTRSTASFTAVVLKASAGASENVTLFSVNKPTEFLTDSKAAGWKVFAAVAPLRRRDQDGPNSLTTDDLEDPLSKEPCILMLGGEGEGLPGYLRSKADVNLSIRGSGRSHNVDSLNVSVAAGILIDSFMKRSNTREQRGSEEEKEEVKKHAKPAGDLF